MRLVRLSYSGSRWVGSLAFFLAVLCVLALGGFLAIAGAGVQVDFLRFRVDLVVDQSVIDLSGDDNAEIPRHQTIALADLDNDSNVDLIAIDNAAEAVTIRLGQGDATFGEASSIPAQDVDGDTFGPIGIVVEDFTSLFEDGGGPDGNLDIAVIGENGELYIAIGDGNGGFAAPDQEVDSTLELFSPTGAVSGDFDGNDAPDIAVADEDLIIVFCNSGGTLELCPGGVLDLNDQSVEGPVIFDIVSGDFDGDSNGDIAALSPEEGAVYVAFGDGNGSFLFDVPVLLPEKKTTGGLAVGRMNGDQIDDIVVSMQDGFPDNSQVSLGSAGRLFTNRPWPAPENATVIALEPFDRDELDDVVFSERGGLAVQLGNGTGDFSDTLGAENASVAGVDGRRLGNAFTLKAADLNNDSLIDLVGLVSGGTEIEVAINIVDQPTETPTNVPSGTPATPTPSVTGTPPTSTPLPSPTPTVTSTAVPTARLGRCDIRVVEANKGALFGVVVGDLDGETGLDIAVSGVMGDGLSTPVGMVYIISNTFQDSGELRTCAAEYAGQGVPTPLPVSDLQMVAVPDAKDIALIDADDDPEMEIAVIGSDASGTPGVHILDRNDAGRWVLAGFEAVAGAPVQIVTDYASDALDQSSRGALDFDGDGETDIVVANKNRVPTILFGAAGLTFDSMLVGNGALSVAATAGDFDDDGRIDFALASADNDEIRFLVQTGTPRTFLPGGNIATTGRVVDMESGFFNEDGIPDIFFAGPVAGAFTTSFLLTTDSGNLSQSSSRPYFLIGNSSPKAVSALLFDPPEARLDGIVVQPQAGELRIGLGDGAGAVSEVLAPLETGATPQDLSHGDIDGDRQRDLVTANGGDGTITILLSSAPPPTPTPVPTASPTPTGTATDTPTEGPESTATAGPSSTVTATMSTPTRTNTKAGIFELSESGCAVDPPAATDLPIGLVAGLVLLLAARFRGVGSGTFESAGRKR